MKATVKILIGNSPSDLRLFAVKESEDPNKIYEIIGEIPTSITGLKEGDEIEGDVDVLSVPMLPKGEIMKSFFIPNNLVIFLLNICNYYN